MAYKNGLGALAQEGRKAFEVNNDGSDLLQIEPVRPIFPDIVVDGDPDDRNHRMTSIVGPPREVTEQIDGVTIDAEDPNIEQTTVIGPVQAGQGAPTLGGAAAGEQLAHLKINDSVQTWINSRGAYYMGDGEVSFAGGLHQTGSAGYQKWYQAYSEIHGNDGDNVIEGVGTYRVSYAGKSKTFDVADIIDGGAGNDTIYGYAGDDILYGGLGDDVLYGGDGKDTLYGGEGDDVLYGGEGKDILYGGDGNDWLFTGSLKDHEGDIMTGGAGRDTFVIGEIDNNFSGGAGWSIPVADIALGTLALWKAGLPTFVKEVVPATLDILNRLAGNDGSSTHTPPTASYAEVTDFDPTKDVVIIPLNPDGKPNIFIDFDQASGNIVIKTDANSVDIIATLSWADVAEIFGQDATKLSPAAKAGMLASLKQTMMIVGSDGVTVGSDYTEVDGIDPLLLQGLGSNRFLIFGAYSGHTIVGMEDNDFLYGTVYDDVLYGYTPEDYGGSAFVPENAQDDQLWGFAGNDLFYGGGGNNLLFGGEGWDTASYETANRGIYVDMSKTKSDANGTYYEVQNGHAQVKSVDGKDVDVIGYDRNYSIENITGSAHDDVIIGDANDNVFHSGAGNDTLVGGGGADLFVLEGGTNTILDFNGEEGDLISVLATVYGINTLDDLEYVMPDENGTAFLRVRSTGVVVSVLENMQDTDFDIARHVKLRGELLTTDDAVDHLIQGNDQANVIVVDNGSMMLLGGGGQDVFVLGGGTFHSIGDFDAGAGEKIMVSKEAYGIDSFDDLRFEYVNETQFKIFVEDTGYVFVGVRQVDDDMKITNLADIVELY
jgi:Ca2+-binding RTX toxin-like protein